MGMFSKLFKLGTKGVTNIVSSKGTRKTTGKAITQAGTKGFIKTSSAVAGQGVTSATAGGKVIAQGTAQAFSKGAGSLAKIGGKVVAGTGLIAIPTGAGLIAYSKYKDTTSLTPEDRRLKFILDQQDRALEQEATSQALEQARTDANPFNFGGMQDGTSGMSGTNGFNPFGVYGDSPQSESGASPFMVIAGIGLLGGAGYLIYKNSKKK